MAGLTGIFCFCLLLVSVRGYLDKTVYQYLVDNGYSSFIQLIGESNLNSTLTGKGPITVFAPSNAAIAKLDPNLMSNLAHNQEEKISLVKYHILNGVVLVPFAAGMEKLTSIEGQPITVWHIGSSLILNNNSRVDPAPNNDILCSNGVVQPIDSVLIPPVFGGDNIAAVLIERDDLFADFFLSIMTSNMTALLESGEYTLFAPVDAAYAEFKKDLFSKDVPRDVRTNAYKEILKYHMVPGKRTASMLKNGQTLFTLHGTPLNVTVMTDGSVILNGNTNVIDADISASNGVIHAVDHLMFPGDLRNILNQIYQQSLIG